MVMSHYLTHEATVFAFAHSNHYKPNARRTLKAATQENWPWDTIVVSFATTTLLIELNSKRLL
jgi:hypothetical protein